MGVHFATNVWSRRGRIHYFLSDHPEFHYKQIDTIEGIEIFDRTRLSSPRVSPVPTQDAWRLGFFLHFLLAPLLAVAVGFVFSRTILSWAELPTLRTNLEEASMLAFGSGFLGMILSFFGCFSVLGYLQRLASLKILNEQTECTLERTGLVRTVRSQADYPTRGYCYKRVGWYRYIVDGVDHEIAGHHNVLFHEFPSAVKDIEENPWRTHRTVHYLSTDPGGIRHFNKKGGSPFRLIIGGPLWLAGLFLFLIAGALLRY